MDKYKLIKMLSMSGPFSWPPSLSQERLHGVSSNNKPCLRGNDSLAQGVSLMNRHEHYAVFIIFPKSRNMFQYPLSKRMYANAFRNAFLELLRLSSNSIASTSREECLVTAQLHCAVRPVEQKCM